VTSQIAQFLRFVSASVRTVSRGPAVYWAWLAVLAVLIVSGVHAYVMQVSSGLVLTSMRDQVSWGFYIGNFTFLVGVAAAAVVLVIPAYIYHWKPIREIVIFGELLALSAIVMCLLFVVVDVGPARPPLAHDPRHWPDELSAFVPRLGRRRPEPVLRPELRRGHPHPVPGVHGSAVQPATRRAAGAAVDTDGESASTR
jgi:hypothetical protein